MFTYWGNVNKCCEVILSGLREHKLMN